MVTTIIFFFFFFLSLEETLNEEGVQLNSWHIQHDGSAAWDRDIGHGCGSDTGNRPAPPS